MFELVVCELPTSYGLKVAGREFAYYGPGEATLPRNLAEALGATIKGPASDEQTAPTSAEQNVSQDEPVKKQHDALPDDFPARDLLYDNLYTTLESVRGATDKELLALKGLGKATLRDIRTAASGSAGALRAAQG